MGSLIEFGTIPIYEPFQYNNDVQLGEILKDLTRIRHQEGNVGIKLFSFSSPDRSIKQQFALRLSRVLSGVFEDDIYLGWMTFQNKTSQLDLLQRVSSIFTEMWGIETEDFSLTHLSKLLSINIDSQTSLSEFFLEELFPIIVRIRNTGFILIVFDFESSDKAIQQIPALLCDSLKRKLSEKNIIIIALNKAPKSETVIPIHTPTVTEAKKASLQNFQLGSQSDQIPHSSEGFRNAVNRNLPWLKSLSILSHPADGEMIDFIDSYYDDLSSELKVLDRVKVITFLKGSGLYLNAEFYHNLNAVSNLNSIEDHYLLSLGLAGTGYSNKEKLKELAELCYTKKTNWDVLSSYFQAHGSTALALGLRQEGSLASWHIDSIHETIDEPEFFKNVFQVKSMMDYTGQILLSGQSQLTESLLRKFLKLLESVTDRYSSYLRRGSGENDSQVLLEASRYQYKIGHLYDRLFNKYRLPSTAKIRTNAYQNAASILQVPSPDDQWFSSIIYRKGTAVSKHNKTAAYEHYSKYATLFYGRFKNNETQLFKESFQDLITAEELATYAIKTGVVTDINKLKSDLGFIVDNLLTRSGSGLSDIDFYKIVLEGFDEAIRSCFISEVNQSFKVSIFVSKGDFHTSLLISEDLTAHLFCVPDIIIVTPNTDIQLLSKKYDFCIIIGAPDTSGGIGEFVVKEDRILEQTYHIRMNFDFSEPVFKKEDYPSRLILCGSGINGVINGWSSIFQDVEKFINKKNKMEELVIGNLLSSVIKRIGSKSVEWLFEKATHKKLTASQNSIESLVESLKIDGRKVSKKEILDELKDLDPTDRNKIISSLQNDKASVLIILDSLIENLSLDQEVEELEELSKYLWGVSKDMIESDVSIKSQSELQQYAVGFNIRHDEILSVLTEYKTQGQIDVKKLADLRVKLHNQTINFRSYIDEHLLN